MNQSKPLWRGTSGKLLGMEHEPDLPCLACNQPIAVDACTLQVMDEGVLRDVHMGCETAYKTMMGRFDELHARRYKQEQEHSDKLIAARMNSACEDISVLVAAATRGELSETHLHELRRRLRAAFNDLDNARPRRA